ncbi:PspC domain-containing protein [Tunicatimonas pelagia]|uniref:PspC domain-containing protein n=1 Tax=Tunicatimonas pelagia TaxID=931531 RepID=UPI002666D768|nr:PspC domain-containing protein [Tunicatimonas pelagia]WKN45873.1 PspC domain-containing protein [Tunicatimonas pelagia]
MAKLSLSYHNKIIAGVCGGLADHFGWDATMVRIIFAVAAIVGFGSPGLVYLVLWLVMKYS